MARLSRRLSNLRAGNTGARSRKARGSESTSAPPSQTASTLRARRYGGQAGGQAQDTRCAKDTTGAPGVHTHRPSGRNGREAQKGKGLSVHYTGWLYDPAQPEMKGRMFDSSRERGPFNFQLGAGQVIPGWDQGFDGMKIGGRRRLIIPPALAYGVDGAGNGIIPPNATLIFEMELLDVQQ